MTDRTTQKSDAASHRLRLARTTVATLGVAVAAYAASDHAFYGDVPGFGRAQALLLVLGGVLCLVAIAPPRLVVRASVLTVTGVLALALGEVAAEVFLAPSIRTAFAYDPSTIFCLAPGRKTTTRLSAINGGRLVIQSTNSDGFRGPELSPVGSETRVIVYGDSFIHAVFSPLEETFPHRLETLLERELDSPVEVINAGVGAYGPDQVLVRMRSELPQLRPDLVIVALFAGNDYGDLLRNKMFKVDDQGQLQQNPWQLAEENAEYFQRNERESMLRRAVREHLQRRRSRGQTGGASQSLEGMFELCSSEAQREYDDYVIDGSNIVSNITADYFSSDVCLQPNEPSAKYRVRLMDAVLRRIDVLTRDAGVQLVFMFIPHPLDAVGSFLGDEVDEQRYPDYSRENLISPLRATAVRTETPFLDLLPVFSTEEASQFYLRGGDDHWNGAGQALAAERMAAFLIERDLLPRLEVLPK